MSVSLQIGTVVPTEETRMGRMLAAGRLTATMRSKRTGDHLTLTFQSKAKIDGKWKNASFAEATHVFIQQGPGGWGSTKLGTYYPPTGKLYLDTDDKAWSFAVLNTLTSAMSALQDTEKFELQESNQCGTCGKALTDPVSIERGIGPTCYGAETGSHHSTKADREQVPPTPEPKPYHEQYAEAAEEAQRHSAALRDHKGRTVPPSFEALAAAVRNGCFRPRSMT